MEHLERTAELELPMKLSLFMCSCILLSILSDVGVQDRVVIQEVVKAMAQTNQLETSQQREFKGKSSCS